MQALAYTYAYSYKCADTAYLAFLDMCNSGEASECELHAIKSYRAKNGKLRWKIELKG